MERRPETATASTLVLDVPGWPGHEAGQHLDVRLTADDGYQAARSYSLAAPADDDRIEITVQEVPDGEVSSYLAEDAASGDSVEVRGPVGGWFVWKPRGNARGLAEQTEYRSLVFCESAVGARECQPWCCVTRP